MPLPCAELRRNPRCAWRRGTEVNITENSISENIQSGTQQDVEKSTEWGRRETRLHTQPINIRLRFKCASPFSPLLTFSLHILGYHAEQRRCACRQTFPSYYTAYNSQRDFPESVFEFSAQCSELLQMHTQRWVCTGNPISTLWLMWSICHKWAQDFWKYNVAHNKKQPFLKRNLKLHNMSTFSDLLGLLKLVLMH